MTAAAARVSVYMTKLLGRKALAAANMPALQHSRNRSSCASLAPAKSLTALRRHDCLM